MSDHDPIQPPPAAPVPPPAPLDEDAGSQALADALRSSFFIVKIIMVVLVVAFLGSGFFTVGPQQKAIILRLGRPVGVGEKALLNPGFHWAFPKPIDEIRRIPFTSLQTAESSVGWYLTPEERAHDAAPPPPQNSLNPASTTYALTADTNIVHVMGILHYRITDPVAFNFDFVDARIFITNALNNALLFATTEYPVDAILTSNKAAFRETVTTRVQDLLDQEHLGITLESPLSIDASPPLALVAIFNQVDTANVKRDNTRSLATIYATNTMDIARGTANSRVYVAQYAQSNLVAMVGAQAKTFTDLRTEFERDPAFFERVRQMIALEEVYTNAQEKILEPHLNGRELRLNLSREPLGTSTNSTAQ
jgi:membrane protease subunit HflK